MTIKQISVFVENTPGALIDTVRALSNAGVDIRALSIADTAEYGILRLIVDKPEKAGEALAKAGCTVNLTDVIGVGVEDKPGGLTEILEILAKAGVGVEYIYAFLGAMGDNLARVIIRADDNAEAVKVLSGAGVSLLSSEEVYGI